MNGSGEKIRDDIVKLDKDGKFDEALELCKDLEKIDPSEVAFWRGYTYLHYNDKKNDAKAYANFYLSAQKDKYVAWTMVAFCYMFGRGVEEDKNRAIEIAEKSQNELKRYSMGKNDIYVTLAYQTLASIYIHNYNTSDNPDNADLEKAEEIYQEAISAGQADAYALLANIYRDYDYFIEKRSICDEYYKKYMEYGDGITFASDYVKYMEANPEGGYSGDDIIDFLNVLSEIGDKNSRRMLAEHYLLGKYVDKNEYAGVEILTDLADKGDILARNLLDKYNNNELHSINDKEITIDYSKPPKEVIKAFEMKGNKYEWEFYRYLAGLLFPTINDFYKDDLLSHKPSNAVEGELKNQILAIMNDAADRSEKVCICLIRYYTYEMMKTKTNAEALEGYKFLEKLLSCYVPLSGGNEYYKRDNLKDLVQFLSSIIDYMKKTDDNPGLRYVEKLFFEILIKHKLLPLYGNYYNLMIKKYLTPNSTLVEIESFINCFKEAYANEVEDTAIKNTAAYYIVLTFCDLEKYEYIYGDYNVYLRYLLEHEIEFRPGLNPIARGLIDYHIEKNGKTIYPYRERAIRDFGINIQNGTNLFHLAFEYFYYDIKNYKKALWLFRLSAQFGEPQALYHMGLFYHYGFYNKKNTGYKKDLSKAEAYYRTAISKMEYDDSIYLFEYYHLARFQLVKLLLQPDNEHRNPEEAIGILADTDLDVVKKYAAHNQIADMYYYCAHAIQFEGVKHPRDFSASVFYERAVSMGHVTAKKELQTLNKNV